MTEKGWENETERERQIVRVCVCVKEIKRECVSVCVCVKQTERGTPKEPSFSCHKKVPIAPMKKKENTKWEISHSDNSFFLCSIWWTWNINASSSWGRWGAWCGRATLRSRSTISLSIQIHFYFFAMNACFCHSFIQKDLFKALQLYFSF